MHRVVGPNAERGHGNACRGHRSGGSVVRCAQKCQAMILTPQHRVFLRLQFKQAWLRFRGASESSSKMSKSRGGEFMLRADVCMYRLGGALNSWVKAQRPNVGRFRGSPK
jgi:hypothetical protein